VAVLVLAFVYVQNRYIVLVDPLTMRIDRLALQVYRHLQTLPKDVVIAGHPWEMDTSAVCHRGAGQSGLSLPRFTGYYAEGSNVSSTRSQRIMRGCPAGAAVRYLRGGLYLAQHAAFHAGVSQGGFTTNPSEPVQARLTDRPAALLEAAWVGGSYPGTVYLVSFAHRKKGRDGGAVH
jgi:hypothetical protein